MNYIPSEIEPKWQKEWENKKSFAAQLSKDDQKFYVLEMFPYPSGKYIWGM